MHFKLSKVPVNTQEAVAPFQHDRKIVYQQIPTNIQFMDYSGRHFQQCYMVQLFQTGIC